MNESEKQRMLDRCEEELEDLDIEIQKLTREKNRSALALKGALERQVQTVAVMRKVVRGEAVQMSIFDQINAPVEEDEQDEE